jgi:hypothetical protein
VVLVFGIAFAVALGIFVTIGLAVAASAEGPEPEPLAPGPLTLRLTRAALLATAAFLALLGAEAAMVAGWLDDPDARYAQAAVFVLEGATDLVLAALMLMPAWSLRRVWVLRLVSVCWFVVGPPVLALTFGGGPRASFYLGLGPDSWSVIAFVVGTGLVWLSSLGGRAPAAPTVATASPVESAPASRSLSRPGHGRGIVTGVVLASLVAVSAWPLAQFTGVNAMGGCAPDWLVPGDPTFCVSGHVDGGKLTVSGRTTLPDGAVVDITEPGGGLLTARRLVVADGMFGATIDLLGRHGVPITVVATMRMGVQPAAVVARYGSDGHAIAGPAARGGCDEAGRTCLQAALTFDLP